MVIYKADFPNGKVYIGKSKSFDDRKIKHYYDEGVRISKRFKDGKRYEGRQPKNSFFI